MKHKYTILSFLSTLLLIFSSQNISAQYYEIANRLPGLIRPALSGSLNYKGFIEADLAGFHIFQLVLYGRRHRS